MSESPISREASLQRGNLQSPISTLERRWVLTFAALVMLVTTLPYLMGYAVQGENWRYTGFVFGVEDGNSYIGKMQRGAAGDWLFRTPYTAQAQRGALAFLPHIVLGKLAAQPGLHVQLVVLFHLFRIVAGILAILATYDFLGLFLNSVRMRRWGLAVAVLGSGLGWLLVMLGHTKWLDSLPLDFYSPETFGFLAIFGLPHLAFGRAMLLWGLRFYLIGNPASLQTCEYANMHTCTLAHLIPGVLLLLLGLMQPLTVLVAWSVMGAHLTALALWQRWMMHLGQSGDWHVWKSFFWRSFWAGVISSPIAIYTAVVFNLDPFLKNWTSQNLILSPHPLHYLIAYGLLIPCAVLGAIRLLRQDAWRGWLPVAWVLMLPLLAYAPYNLQRRLVEGLWVALVTLVFVAFEHHKSKLFRRSFVVLLLAFPSTIFLLLGGLMAASTPAEPLFRPADEIDTFEYLAGNTDGESIVLGSFNTGNALPAWSPVFVLIGHGPESVGLVDLEPRVTAFYQASTPESDRLALLEEFGVDYVFWGPAERASGNWNLFTSAYLTQVYQQGEYVVFSVNLQSK